MSVEFTSKVENPNYPGVIDISAEEVLEKKSALMLVDVRQPDEFSGELGHIDGAELLVLDQLPSKMSDLPKDKDIVFICRSGNRSAKACTMAAMDDISRCYNMAGGMLKWNELGLPVIKPTTES